MREGDTKDVCFRRIKTCGGYQIRTKEVSYTCTPKDWDEIRDKRLEDEFDILTGY